MTTPNNAYIKLVTALNEAVAVGKILDVSGLKQDGTGARKINMPKTAKGKKRWVENFPVVSNNYESYLLAMQLLGNDYLPLAERYRTAYGNGTMGQGQQGTQQIQQTRQTQQTQVRSPARLGAPITEFPVFGNTPAPIQLGAVKQVAKSPRATTPKAPKAPKSPTVRQPAILQVPTPGLNMNIQQPTINPALNAAQQTVGNFMTRPTATIVPTIPVPRTNMPGTVMFGGVPTVPLVQTQQQSPRQITILQPQSPRQMTQMQPQSPRQMAQIRPASPRQMTQMQQPGTVLQQIQQAEYQRQQQQQIQRPASPRQMTQMQPQLPQIPGLTQMRQASPRQTTQGGMVNPLTGQQGITIDL